MIFPSITEVVLRDGQQSLIASRMRTNDMVPILSKMDLVGYSSLEAWGGATYDCCLRFLNEDPWERLKTLKKYLKQTKIQMLLRGKNLVGYKKYHDSVVELFIKTSAKEGVAIFRIFDALNDIDNIESSITFARKQDTDAQGTISYTTSPIHNLNYWLTLAKNIEDIGASSLAIKDMAGLLRPKTAYTLIKKLKKNLNIPIHLHTHSTTGLADATNFKAFEAGVDNIDTSISSFSNLYAHTATESMIAMMYDNQSSPFNNELLTEISKYFENIRKNYSKYEGSMKGIDVKMLTKEIPRIRKDVGYIPLVTPTSQIVGAQALSNIIDGERYKNLNKEFIDLIRGSYGKIPGVVDLDLQRKVEDYQLHEIDHFDVDILKKDFISFCEENNLKKIKNSDTDLLNFILFPEQAKDFYLQQRKPSFNDIIELQEGFGFYLSD